MRKPGGHWNHLPLGYRREARHKTKTRGVNSRSMLALSIALIVFVPRPGYAFTHRITLSVVDPMELRATGRDDDIRPEMNGVSTGDDVQDFGEEDLQVAGVMLEDLSWRVEKLRLEEENKRRFLKSKPRFLPYEECRKWVQAFNRWSSELEW